MQKMWKIKNGKKRRVAKKTNNAKFEISASSLIISKNAKNAKNQKMQRMQRI